MLISDTAEEVCSIGEREKGERVIDEKSHLNSEHGDA